MLKETKYDDGTYDYSTAYQYDKNGNKIKQTHYSQYYEGVASSVIYEYDSKGELLKSIEYDSDENIKGYTDWIDGGRSGFYSYDASGALDQSCEYINGKRVEKHYENGELTSTWEY